MIQLSKLKILILALLLSVPCNSQQTCGQMTCAQGWMCISNRCVLNPEAFIIAPVATSQLPQAPTPYCPAHPCSNGFTCLDSLCILISSLSGGNRTFPTRNVTYGIVNRQAFMYAMNFCDQNIYHLCQKFPLFMTPSSEGYAVIFFNEQKKVKIRQQALGVNALDNYPYNWNFHVVFVWKKGKASRVYDFDSRLPWGVSFMEYYDRAVLTKRGEPPTMARAVPCRDYFDQFSSNRAGALEPFPGGWKYKYIPSTPNMIGLEKPLRNTIRYYYNSSNTDPFFGKLLKSKEDIKKFFMM